MPKCPIIGDGKHYEELADRSSIAKQNISINQSIIGTKIFEKFQTVFAPTIVLLLDTSTSMYSIKKEMLMAVNEFLRKQAKETDHARLSLYLFNHQLRCLYRDTPISDVVEIADYPCDGSTAMYDAIGNVAAEYSDRMDVMMIVVTDGVENSSGVFGRDDIQNLIDYKKRDNWHFMYLSNNFISASEGVDMGMIDNNIVGSLPSMIKRELSNVVLQYRQTSKVVGDEPAVVGSAESEIDNMPMTKPVRQISTYESMNQNIQMRLYEV